MKKILAIVLAIALCMTAAVAMAALTITDENGKAWTTEGGVYKLTENTTYTLSGETYNNGVHVTAPGATLILNGVTLITVESSDSPLQIDTNSEDTPVTIILADGAVNTLKSGMYLRGEINARYSPAALRNDDNALVITCERADETGHVCGDSCGALIAIAGGAYDGPEAANIQYSGAGIGSNSFEDASDITIKGGRITAEAIDGGGAGIGGGDYANASSITISGGIVTAHGGKFGAGIGSGYDMSAINITISGGTVTATGRENGAGLGGGFSGSASNILMSPAAGEILEVRIGGGDLQYIEEQTDVSDSCNQNAEFYCTVHNHSGGMANCEAKATCEECAQPYGGLDSDNHVGAARSAISDDGHRKYCTCGAELSFEPHTPGAPATETTPQTCTVCGWVLAPVVIPTPTPEMTAMPESTVTPVPDTDNLPKTGDDSSLILWAALLCLAGAGTLMIRRAKEN